MALRIDAPESNQKDVVSITLNGRLDTATHKDLETALQPFLSGGTRLLILDLSGLDFISSAGIRVLLSTRSELHQKNGALLLINVPAPIAAVLEIIESLPGIAVLNSEEEIDRYLAEIQKKPLDS